MVNSSLSLATKNDYIEDHSITDSLSLMNIKPKARLQEVSRLFIPNKQCLLFCLNKIYKFEGIECGLRLDLCGCF